MPEGLVHVAIAFASAAMEAKLNFQMLAKSGRDVAEPQDVCHELLCFRVLAAMGEVLTEWVSGGVPPRGLSMELEPCWSF